MKDMNGQTILLISDMRQVYLAEILTKKGMSVRCLDIRNSQTVEEQLLKLKKFLAGAAMLVNTVPAPVVTRVIIKELPRDAYILDIASKPGGTDFACAKEFGIRADLVLGIPGKYAPKESAYILERSMERFATKQKSIDR